MSRNMASMGTGYQAGRGQVSHNFPVDPFPDLPELLTTRQQIARVLGYASWDDRSIKPLILANGCPVTRLPGEGRKGAWRARKSAILAWLEARAA